MSNEERSLGDETPAPQPTGPSPFGTPNPPANGQKIEPPTVSIIDNILQLDDFLSGDVRRAEKTARFCAKPWLEAEIDELAFELEQVTDNQGNPLPAGEPSLGEQVRDARTVALEIQTLQAEYGAAFVSVRMAQLSSDDWKAWRAKWREVFEKAGEKPDEFWDDLIEVSAKTPPITAAQSSALRKKLGSPQMDELASKAWEVQTNSGVAIPKSPLSSHVLRQAARAQS